MKDPRTTYRGNLKHPLDSIFFLVISAVISGCNEWKTIEVFGEAQIEWLRKYFPFEHGIPSQDTLGRVFAALDTDVFGKYFIEWTEGLCDLTDGDVVAFDGKTMRGSYDNQSNKSALHIVSAYAQKNRLCLGQIVTNQKSNEITAIPELLEMLSLEKATVTLDAMGCQKKIVEKIRAKNADYVIAVKNNQKELYDQIDKLFAIVKPSSEDLDYDVGHGRVEKRKCFVIDDFTFFDDNEDWKDLKSIVKIETKRFNKSTLKTNNESRYYITSHNAKASVLNQVIRNHWSIENNLHWMLDVVFDEDNSRKRKGNSPANFNIISKIALGIIERNQKKESKRQKRFRAGFDPEYRTELLNF